MGDRIRQARLAAGMTQDEVVARSGGSRASHHQGRLVEVREEEERAQAGFVASCWQGCSA